MLSTTFCSVSASARLAFPKTIVGLMKRRQSVTGKYVKAKFLRRLPVLKMDGAVLMKSSGSPRAAVLHRSRSLYCPSYDVSLGAPARQVSQATDHGTDVAIHGDRGCAHVPNGWSGTRATRSAYTRRLCSTPVALSPGGFLCSTGARTT